jgi:SAM-dependent methyltransferase
VVISANPSFRDPSGSCWSQDGRIFRHLVTGADAELDHFLGTAPARQWMEDGRLVKTRSLARTEFPGGEAQAPAGGSLYEHERIDFPSYPYEWAPDMLHAAGLLTAQLAAEALPHGYGLKDATPYNVLFRGSTPVFIDVPSFEKRVPGDPIWKPYAQFVRTFLLPLLAYRTWGIPLADCFTTRRDGVEPEFLYRWCGWARRLRPVFLSLVSMPVWLSRPGEASAPYRDRTQEDPAKARFILDMTLKRLPRLLAKVQPAADRASTWSDYMSTHSYNDAAFKLKESFVREALAEARPARVLDVGANTGHFSALAASAGASVVAVDSDVQCVGGIWRRAQTQGLDILPLVVDFSRPSPALGWRNREQPSFLARARGSFDAVLMLAVLHHLLVTERIPLEAVLEVAAEITRDYLLVEFVAPEDPMFIRIARGREHLHAGLNVQVFEHACRGHFDILRSTRVGESHRWLYWLRKRERPL